jgi:hypothetical protein
LVLRVLEYNCSLSAITSTDVLYVKNVPIVRDTEDLTAEILYVKNVLILRDEISAIQCGVSTGAEITTDRLLPQKNPHDTPLFLLHFLFTFLQPRLIPLSSRISVHCIRCNINRRHKRICLVVNSPIPPRKKHTHTTHSSISASHSSCPLPPRLPFVISHQFDCW